MLTHYVNYVIISTRETHYNLYVLNKKKEEENMGLMDGIRKIRDEVFPIVQEEGQTGVNQEPIPVRTDHPQNSGETSGLDASENGGESSMAIILEAYKGFKDPKAKDLYRVEEVVSTLNNLDENTRNSTARILLKQFNNDLLQLQDEAVCRIESIQRVTKEFVAQYGEDSKYIEKEIETKRQQIAEKQKELADFVAKTNQEILDLENEQKQKANELSSAEIGARDEIKRMNDIIKILGVETV